MKKIICCLLSLFLLCSCAQKNTDKDYIIVASDLHYMSRTLGGDTEFFEKLSLDSDGKAMAEIEEVVDTFINEVIARNPDALVLTGDITYNGERVSHEELAIKLQKVKDAGIKVCIIPGNHDVNNRMAAAFYDNGYTYVPSVTREEFKEIYQSFYDDSIESHDLSSVVEVDKHTWLLLIESKENTVDDDTMVWIETVLKKAKRNHIDVISATHENILIHNEMFVNGYVLNNADKLKELLVSHGVRLNLAGHLHIQHTKRDGLKEILTSALSIYPSHYGVIKIDGNEYEYKVDKLHNMRLVQYEKDYWIKTSVEKMEKQGLSTEAAVAFANINLAYFSNETLDITPYQKGIDELKQDLRYGGYVEGILEEIQKN